MAKKNVANNYYRKITESLPQTKYIGDYFVVFLLVFFFFSLALSGYLYIKLLSIKDLRRQTAENLTYWQQISKNHPNSPDAFYESGFYAAKLGDKKKATEYLEKALILDPEFQKAKDLIATLKK